MTLAPPTTQLLFFDGFDDLDAVAPLEILVAAGFPAVPVRPPGHESTLTSAHGLQLTVPTELDDTAELVVVPGGGWIDRSPSGVRALTTTDLPQQLSRLHAGGTVIASVCTGAMLLAAAGLLSGRPALTNHEALDDLADAGADVQRVARVVDDGSVVTSGGPSAGLDLALRLVHRFAGTAAAAGAAQRLEYAPIGLVLVSGAD
jgi:transcriptional regulator GlxA family with amidase domain